MCTVISKNANGLILGRNMDIECSFGEKFVFTPRNYPIKYKCVDEDKCHFAIFGTAAVIDNYPLYAEAANEHGLCVAALNFVGNAHYRSPKNECINLAPYELILKVLSICKTVREAQALLEKVNLVNIPFKNDLPLSQLHFYIADKNESIVFESTTSGNNVYSNSVGVLTNNPEFPYHIHNLSNFNYLKNQTLSPTFDRIKPYSLGLGAYGLPGDFSSSSRFVRASYLSHFSSWENKIPQMLHILNNVSVPKGAVIADNKEHYTLYSSVIDSDTQIYYYRTYDSFDTKIINASDFDKTNNRLAIVDIM